MVSSSSTPCGMQSPAGGFAAAAAATSLDKGESTGAAAHAAVASTSTAAAADSHATTLAAAAGAEYTASSATAAAAAAAAGTGDTAFASASTSSSAAAAAATTTNAASMAGAAADAGAARITVCGQVIHRRCLSKKIVSEKAFTGEDVCEGAQAAGHCSRRHSAGCAGQPTKGAGSQLTSANHLRTKLADSSSSRAPPARFLQHCFHHQGRVSVLFVPTASHLGYCCHPA